MVTNRIQPIFSLGMALTTLATGATGLVGCIGAPEKCHGCLAALADGGLPPLPDSSANGGATGTGGLPGTGGGAPVGTGGVGSGGRTGGDGTGGGMGGAAAGGFAGGAGRAAGGAAAAGRGGGAVGGVGVGGGAGGRAGVGGNTALGGAGIGGSGMDPDLALWYRFDENNGTRAADSARFGGMARDATLMTIGAGASAMFSPMRQVGTNAVSLVPPATTPNSNCGFVALPSLQMLAPDAVTIAVWVNLAAATATQNWERIFDFGTGATGRTNIYLTARAADAAAIPVRFAITTTGHGVAFEQRLDSPAALPANGWHHLAVVLPAGSPYTGTLYLDGVSVATNTAMTAHVAEVGATPNNWLGRSQFTDPCFNGLLDDFRVYRRALSPAEVSALILAR